MGRSHAVSGFAMGLAVAPGLGLHTFADVLPFAVTTGGYALVPDLDCASATATRMLGPVTRGLGSGLRWCSARLYAATKGPRDEDGRGTHRHLTHTLAFAALLGGLAAGLTAAYGPWAVLGFLAFGVALAVDAAGPTMLVAAGVAAGCWFTAATSADVSLLDALSASRGRIGLAVGIGCFTHCLGDSVTRAGCPWLFPVPIAGETWYEIRPPTFLRFRAGGPFEHVVVFPALLVASGLLLPGVWPYLLDLAGGAHVGR